MVQTSDGGTDKANAAEKYQKEEEIIQDDTVTDNESIKYLNLDVEMNLKSDEQNLNEIQIAEKLDIEWQNISVKAIGNSKESGRACPQHKI